VTTALKKEIKKLARESFREVLQEELVKLRPHQARLIPIDTATPQEIKDFKRGRAQHAAGKYHLLSDVLHEMDRKFGYPSRKITRKSSR
jgi:hypothetical protein